MKKSFSDEQIISILREAEAWFLPVSSAVRTPYPTPPKSMEVWRCPRLSA